MTQPVQYYAKQVQNTAPQGGYPQEAQDGHALGYGMRGADQQQQQQLQQLQQPAPQQGYGNPQAQAPAQAQGYGQQAAPYVQVQLQAGQPQAGQAGQAAQAAQAGQAAQGAQAAQTARAAQVQYAQGGQVGQGYAAHAQRMYAQAAAAAAGYARPTTSVPQQLQRPRKRKRGAAFWVIIVLVVLCLAAAGLIAFNMLNQPSSRSGVAGQLEGKSPAEIQAELDRIVDEGMFNISIASVVQMANGSSPAELRIENVPGNPYLMKVAITLDDTGQMVYQTDAIEPNFHIQSDTLDVTLPAGTYDATATFTALDPETEEEVGQAAAKVLIQVQS